MNEQIRLSRREALGVAAAAVLGGGAAAARAGWMPVAPPAPLKPEDWLGGRPDGQPEEDSGGAALEINAETIAHAQKLLGIEFTEAERTAIAEGFDRSVAGYRRRRERALPNELAPATVFDARAAARTPGSGEARSAGGEPGRGVVVRSADGGRALPADEEEIAFAPVTDLSRWIERRQISSERLTRIYLDRIRRYGPRLECVITVTDGLAMEQARRADREIAAGRYRGSLHGVPWGAKDLFDTAGILTTWGATPYRERVPETDAAVVRRLEEAGAVLVAKTTLGAIAYGDIWFGGTTRNPWDMEQGSSGSSAGSAAGTAAGLFGFSLGTETLGSIVSPSMRCGTTGLRPTFGRVSRTGAMALCWSLDKVGPICRTVEDCALVLEAIHGADAGDPSSVDERYDFDATKGAAGLTVGIVPGWFEGRGASEADRAALEALRESGARVVEIEIPDLDPSPLLTILMVEAAASFEELTLTNRDDELVWQEPQAWPNSFRKAWFTPAIELMQAQRLRREVCVAMARVFEGVDAVFGPSFAGGMLLITNNTGHPSLTLRAGFDGDGRPRGVTLWGRLFDEGTILRLGMELERRLGVWDRRPEAYKGEPGP